MGTEGKGEMTNNREEEARLVKRAAAGDMNAFAELCERKQQYLLMNAVFLCGSHEDAQDAVQETFLKMYRHIGRLKSPEKFGSWILTTLRRECLNILSRRKDTVPIDEIATERAMDFTEDEFLPEKYMEDQDTRRQIVGIIKGLSDRYRETILYYYYDELSVAQIAELMGASTSAVTMNLSRARAVIKKELLKGDAAPMYASAGMAATTAGNTVVGKALFEGAQTEFTRAELLQFQAQWKYALAHAGKSVKAAALLHKAAAVLAPAAAAVVIAVSAGAPVAPPEVTGEIAFTGADTMLNYRNPASASLTVDGVEIKAMAWTLTEEATGEVVASGDGFGPVDLAVVKARGASGLYLMKWVITDKDGFRVTLDREVLFG